MLGVEQAPERFGGYEALEAQPLSSRSGPTAGLGLVAGVVLVEAGGHLFDVVVSTCGAEPAHRQHSGLKPRAGARPGYASLAGLPGSCLAVWLPPRG